MDFGVCAGPWNQSCMDIGDYLLHFLSSQNQLRERNGQPQTLPPAPQKSGVIVTGLHEYSCLHRDFWTEELAVKFI